MRSIEVCRHAEPQIYDDVPVARESERGLHVDEERNRAGADPVHLLSAGNAVLVGRDDAVTGTRHHGRPKLVLVEERRWLNARESLLRIGRAGLVGAGGGDVGYRGAGPGGAGRAGSGRRGACSRRRVGAPCRLRRAGGRSRHLSHRYTKEHREEGPHSHGRSSVVQTHPRAKWVTRRTTKAKRAIEKAAAR